MLYMLDPRTLAAFSSGLNLRPRLHLPSVAHLDIDRLRRTGIEGIVFDVDNTLTRHAGAHIHNTVQQRFDELCAAFPSAIFSNCSARRHAQLGSIFTLPIVDSGLKKPQTKGFRRAAQLLGLPVNRLAMVGDRLLTDILGANRMGMFSVLVDPFSAPEPAAIGRLRRLERWRLRRMARSAGS